MAIESQHRWSPARSGHLWLHCNLLELLHVHPGMGSIPDEQAEPHTLESLVNDLVQQVHQQYADRLAVRPKAIRNRIVRLIDIALLPHRRPSGRPRLQSVNKAVDMYRRQPEAVRRGKLAQVNWNVIALQCVPGYAKIRTEARRRDELKRLRDAVHARLQRKRRHGEPPSSRAT
jgi:hypothetical protein